MDQSLGAYIDQFLVVTAGRLSAGVDADLLKDKKAAETWDLVARATRHMLRGPLPAEDRRSLMWVEVDQFTPGVCQQRLRYVLWRSEQERKAAAKQSSVQQFIKGAVAPSGFNVLEHDLKAEVDAIMAHARANLPSIDCGESKSETTDASSECPQIVQPPKNMIMSEDEIRRQQQMGQDEEEMLQAVQELQLKHFSKYRKWVDVTLLDADAAAVKLREREQQDSADKTPKQKVEKASESLTQSGSKSASPVKAAVTAAAPAPSGGDLSAILTQLQRGDLSSLKQSSYGRRPPRPSETRNDEEEEAAIAAIYGSPDTTQPPAPTPTRPAATSASPAAQPSNGSPSAQRTSASASAGRGNRWQIVEYDNNDDDDDRD